MTSRMCWAYCFLVTPGIRFLGALELSTKLCWTERSQTRTSCSCSKLQSLTNSQLGEVDVHFSLVDTLSTEIAVHLFLGDSLVVDMRIWVYEESIRLTRDCLEKCRTTTIISTWAWSQSRKSGVAYLPGLPSTTSISPLRTSPSKFLRIWILVCCLFPISLLKRLAVSSG